MRPRVLLKAMAFLLPSRGLPMGLDPDQAQYPKVPIVLKQDPFIKWSGPGPCPVIRPIEAFS